MSDYENQAVQNEDELGEAPNNFLEEIEDEPEIDTAGASVAGKKQLTPKEMTAVGAFVLFLLLIAYGLYAYFTSDSDLTPDIDLQQFANEAVGNIADSVPGRESSPVDGSGADQSEASTGENNLDVSALTPASGEDLVIGSESSNEAPSLVGTISRDLPQADFEIQGEPSLSSDQPIDAQASAGNNELPVINVLPTDPSFLDAINRAIEHVSSKVSGEIVALGAQYDSFVMRITQGEVERQEIREIIEQLTLEVQDMKNSNKALYAEFMQNYKNAPGVVAQLQQGNVKLSDGSYASVEGSSIPVQQDNSSALASEQVVNQVSSQSEDLEAQYKAAQARLEQLEAKLASMSTSQQPPAPKLAPISNENLPFKYVAVEIWENTKFAILENSRGNRVELTIGEERGGWTLTAFDTLNRATFTQNTTGHRKIVEIN